MTFVATVMVLLTAIARVNRKPGGGNSVQNLETRRLRSAKLHAIRTSVQLNSHDTYDAFDENDTKARHVHKEETASPSIPPIQSTSQENVVSLAGNTKDLHVKNNAQSQKHNYVTISDREAHILEMQAARKRERIALEAARQAECAVLRAAQQARNRDNIQDDAADSAHLAQVVEMRNRMLAYRHAAPTKVSPVQADDSSQSTQSTVDASTERCEASTFDSRCDTPPKVMDDHSTTTKGSGAIVDSVPEITTRVKDFILACRAHAECSSKKDYCTIQGQCKPLNLCTRSLASPALNPLDDVCPSRSSGTIDLAVPTQRKHSNAHKLLPKRQNRSSVLRVQVCDEECISGITFTYRDENTVSWGKGEQCPESASQTFEVPVGQYIHSIKMRAAKSFLSGIQFVTDSGTASSWFGKWEGRISLHRANKGFEIWSLEYNTDHICGLVLKFHERLAGLR